MLNGVKFVKLFSYVVARDYGFAPNPFYGFCTLATCKPKIREKAEIGDWIIGTGSRKHDRGNFLVYAMCVSEVMTFSEYWNDPRFRCKRPNLRGSLKQCYGDNIYSKDETGNWHQQDSHHSFEGGKQNCSNLHHDTRVDRVLISNDHYYYWGGEGLEIPEKFRNYNGEDICKQGVGHKNRFSLDMVEEFIGWSYSLETSGYVGEPLNWGEAFND